MTLINEGMNNQQRKEIYEKITKTILIKEDQSRENHISWFLGLLYIYNNQDIVVLEKLYIMDKKIHGREKTIIISWFSTKALRQIQRRNEFNKWYWTK